ncbi:MAG: hypothetical protein S4CHLAM102_06330 [Chlamydiia bacterium]|nr:hypothetical protein [Chlamydiia bacterium]
MSRFFLLFFLIFGSVYAKEHKRFAILTLSYNNQSFARQNLSSTLRQQYDNFYVVYVNDCSTDRTQEIVENYTRQIRKEDQLILINNSENKGALRNLYEVIHNVIDDDDIIVIVDGDDALINLHVLEHLNEVYTTSGRETWLTYGQFCCMSNRSKGWTVDMPEDIVERCAFREFVHLPSHLRTFSAWLFKKICVQDLMLDGEFFPMTCDVAIMMPMIEMARDHFQFIQKPLYLYNDMNPISDHHKDESMQRFFDRHVRTNRRYQPLLNKDDIPMYQ